MKIVNGKETNIAVIAEPSWERSGSLPQNTSRTLMSICDMNPAKENTVVHVRNKPYVYVFFL